MRKNQLHPPGVCAGIPLIIPLGVLFSRAFSDDRV